MVIEPAQSITDRELVERFQKKNDQSAFEALVNRHSGHAYQIAYAFLNNREDAEEVVQDAFMRIYRNLPNFRGDAEFTTWMYRIVTNLCNNKYRWNKVRGSGKTISIDAPVDSHDSNGDGALKFDLPDERMMPDRQVAFEELRTRLDKAMDALPESYRQAVLLRNVQHLEYDQIAEMLNCAVGTVKSRINRGRELLRQALEL
ncbi:MAG: sigma-70 family RNA polymerase sigma factor [Lentisphaeria bacterium]|nr:sigma-70 family RNA polymerase sigma factor [Lentisphaeria bacterium]